MKNHKTKKQVKNHVTELIVEELKNKKLIYGELIQSKSHIDTFCAVGTAKARRVAQDSRT